MVLFLLGLVLAALRPEWLTGSLEAAVGQTRSGAPIIFVTLSALLTPIHLNGLLLVLSPVIWPVPIAAGLSYLGSILGCALTSLLVVRLGTRPVTDPTGGHACWSG